MGAAARNGRNNAGFQVWLTLGLLSAAAACDGAHGKGQGSESTAPRSTPQPAPALAASSTSAAPSPSAPAAPVVAAAAPTKVEVKDEAMGTSLHFIAYTSPQVDEAATRAAIARAIAEIRRLEALLSEWKPDSEIGQVNARSGEWVAVGPESCEGIGRGLWAGTSWPS